MKKVIAGAALVATLIGSATPALAETATGTATVTTTATAPATTTTSTAPATTTTSTAPATTTTSTAPATTTTSTAPATTTSTATTTTVEAGAALPEVSLTPDKLFYFLKVWVEKVQLALTSEGIERATLLEEQAQTRMAEAVKMAEAGKSDLAQTALTEAQAKLAAASQEMQVAAAGGKSMDELIKQIEGDQTKFVSAVNTILAKLPEDVKEEVAPLTAELMVQLATAQDTATKDPATAEEAEKVAEEAGLKKELNTLQPRMVLVLKAMAKASGKDFAEVFAMYQQNPGLGRIAKALGLKMGPVQHAAQIEWKKAQAGAQVTTEQQAQTSTTTAPTTVQNAQTLSTTTATSVKAEDGEDDDDKDEAKKGEKKSHEKDEKEKKEHPVAKGLEKLGKSLDQVKGKGNSDR